MITYLIKSALLLAILYGGFALLLSKETFHRFNRLALLSVMIMSLVLPAIHIEAPSFLPRWESVFDTKESSTNLTTYPTDGEEYMEEEGSLMTSIPLEEEEFLEGENNNVEKTSPLTLWKEAGVEVIYLAGVLGSVIFFLFQLFRFWSDTKGGTSTRDEEGNTIVIRGGEFAPYSFLHYIIISVSDYERLRKPILAHEQAHIRLGHSWDLLLLEAVKAVQWFNPFVYLLGRDLKAVHEYEADNAVLNQGIDAKTYQLLLVTKAVGNRLQTFGNNLSHHSLKKRIKMMHKKTSNRWMMTKGIVLPVMMALAVVAFAKPKAEEIPAIENENTLPADNNTTNNPEDALTRIPNEGEDLSVNKPMETPSIPVTEKADDNKVYDKVDELASFPGGTDACYRWLSDHIKYPEECKEKGIEGEVTVLFVVEKDGSISDIKAQNATDEAFVKEVIRVVSSMPKWKPAKVNGEVVRSRMHFPINFGFTDKEKKMVYFKIGKGSLSQEITSVTGQGTPSGEVTDDNVYSDPETNASFPGGMEALYKWISENLRYPEECKANNIQGRVIVQFVIDTDGSITEIKAIRSPDDVLSQEAIRVLSAMPKWKPATSDGKNPVRSLFRLPMNFRLPPAQTEQNPNN